MRDKHGVCMVCDNRRYVNRRVSTGLGVAQTFKGPCPGCVPTGHKRTWFVNYERLRPLKGPECEHLRILYVDFFGPIETFCLDCGIDERDI